MKRFFGMLLALGGGAATIWGGYHALIGESSLRYEFTPDFSMSMMTIGLIGIAVCTLGIIWVRD